MCGVLQLYGWMTIETGFFKNWFRVYSKLENVMHIVTLVSCLDIVCLPNFDLLFNYFWQTFHVFWKIVMC